MLKLIIVDDSGMARMMIGKCFQIAARSDVRIREAADGAIALKLLAAEVPDMLVMDLNMPNMDGMECLKAVRSMPQYNAIKIVMITSSLNPTLERQLTEAGADCVMKKPVSPMIVSEKMDMLNGGVSL